MLPCASASHRTSPADIFARIQWSPLKWCSELKAVSVFGVSRLLSNEVINRVMSLLFLAGKAVSKAHVPRN
jgi:hypothetical protein